MGIFSVLGYVMLLGAYLWIPVPQLASAAPSRIVLHHVHIAVLSEAPAESADTEDLVSCTDAVVVVPVSVIVAHQHRHAPRLLSCTEKEPWRLLTPRLSLEVHVWDNKRVPQMERMDKIGGCTMLLSQSSCYHTITICWRNQIEKLTVTSIVADSTSNRKRNSPQTKEAP